MRQYFEIFRLLYKIGVKPKDLLGLGGDVVKMGKSLFNTRVNPKLLQFIEKNQKIPTKILEEIKIHGRTLKNVTESQRKLFEANIRDILNAKTIVRPKQFDKNFIRIPKKLYDEIILGKPPVTSVQRPATSVKEQAAEAFKGWKPKVIEGGKGKVIPKNKKRVKEIVDDMMEFEDPSGLATGGIANHFRKK